MNAKNKTTHLIPETNFESWANPHSKAWAYLPRTLLTL